MKRGGLKWNRSSIRFVSSLMVPRWTATYSFSPSAFFSAAFYLLCYKWLVGTEMDSAAYYISWFLTYLFLFLMSVNISFALFNILPLYPLDGYRFIAAFTGESNGFMTFLRRNSMYIMLGIIVLDWVFTLVPALEIYSPFYWYFNVWGDMIKNGFIAMWRLII